MSVKEQAAMVGKLAMRFVEACKTPAQWQPRKKSGTAGVYALLCDGEVVYVGQSVNIPTRLADHNRIGPHRPWTHYIFIEADEERFALEQLLISHFKPRDNGAQ